MLDAFKLYNYLAKSCNGTANHLQDLAKSLSRT